MREPITVGGHLRIRPFNTAESYPSSGWTTTCARRWWPATRSTCAARYRRTWIPAESVHAGNPAAQAEQVMTNVEMLLAEAGASVEHVVSCTVYLTDIRHREAVYRVLGRRLKGVYPVFTGLVVSALARPEWLVEVTVVAVRP
jgi:Putative translation initiation inhibitor, yjgF family